MYQELKISLILWNLFPFSKNEFPHSLPPHSLAVSSQVEHLQPVYPQIGLPVSRKPFKGLSKARCLQRINPKEVNTMDKMQKIAITKTAVIIAFLAVAAVTAKPSSPSTPLYTFRMEQASSKMNFLSTEVKEFLYLQEHHCFRW
jgi:hypothetical protein